MVANVSMDTFLAWGYCRSAILAGIRNVRIQRSLRAMEPDGLEPTTSCMP